MLCSIPAYAINADSLQGLDVCLELLLNAWILRFQVLHSYFAVNDLVSVIPVRHTTVRMVQVGIFPVVSHPVQITVGVVGDNIDDDLYAHGMSGVT